MGKGEDNRALLRAYAAGGNAPQGQQSAPNATPGTTTPPPASQGPGAPQDAPPGGKGAKSGTPPKGQPGGKGAKSGGGGFFGRLANGSQALQAKVASAPTPGGSGALLVILLLFVVLIVPVAAGKTRFQLFWLTLLGRTSLPDTGTPAAGEPVPVASPNAGGGGGSSSFGGVTPAAAEGSGAGPIAFPMPLPGSTGLVLPGVRL